ncbi:TIGR03619 family F420-dependent LLM class oxidoreductase [Streptomyces sp. NPDC048489]|uniref:TIGR03619 family F420-dependent LLM class oxidoreductase n=1 Tax=Streptomyces sp. NPDC048489 TaxID=3154504 RepID=UPI0034433332
MPLKLGLGLPQMREYNIGQDIPLVAKAAEDIGYQSVYVYERTLFPLDQSGEHGLYNVPDLAWPAHYRDVAEPIVSLTLAAAATERITLGTSVLVSGYHAPFELSRVFATLDNASGGRVLLGLGTGWSQDEFEAAGSHQKSERGAALDEFLDVLHAIEGPNPVSYQGNKLKISASEVGPKPAGHIPVFLAATNRVAWSRLVKRADGWMPVAGLQEMASGWQTLQEIAAEHGRKQAIPVIVRANCIYSAKHFEGDDRQLFQGSVAQIIEDLEKHATLGFVDEVLLDLTSTVWDARQLVDVAAEIFTAVQSAGF